MLAGRNPFEPIKEHGHFREYTFEEMRLYAKSVGLLIDKTFSGNYFDYRYLAHNRKSSLCLGFLNLVYDIVPPKLKPGITVILKQSSSG
jgi:hypothetical protein